MDECTLINDKCYGEALPSIYRDGLRSVHVQILCAYHRGSLWRVLEPGEKPFKMRVLNKKKKEQRESPS
jgi:hypothetical protein